MAEERREEKALHAGTLSPDLVASQPSIHSATSQPHFSCQGSRFTLALEEKSTRRCIWTEEAERLRRTHAYMRGATFHGQTPAMRHFFQGMGIWNTDMLPLAYFLASEKRMPEARHGPFRISVKTGLEHKIRKISAWLTISIMMTITKMISSEFTRYIPLALDCTSCAIS